MATHFFTGNIQVLIIFLDNGEAAGYTISRQGNLSM